MELNMSPLKISESLVVEGLNIANKYKCFKCHLIPINPMKDIKNKIYSCNSCISKTVTFLYDTPAMQEIRTIKVKCSACNWNGTLKEYEKHFLSCDYLIHNKSESNHTERNKIENNYQDEVKAEKIKESLGLIDSLCHNRKEDNKKEKNAQKKQIAISIVHNYLSEYMDISEFTRANILINNPFSIKRRSVKK